MEIGGCWSSRIWLRRPGVPRVVSCISVCRKRGHMNELGDDTMVIFCWKSSVSQIGCLTLVLLEPANFHTLLPNNCRRARRTVLLSPGTCHGFLVVVLLWPVLRLANCAPEQQPWKTTNTCNLNAVVKIQSQQRNWKQNKLCPFNFNLCWQEQIHRRSQQRTPTDGHHEKKHSAKKLKSVQR